MTFKFAGALLRLIEYRRLIVYDNATTVREGLDRLVADWPMLKSVLFDELGTLRKSHRLFLNGRPITETDLGTEVTANDCVQIVTAIAGGA